MRANKSSKKNNSDYLNSEYFRLILLTITFSLVVGCAVQSKYDSVMFSGLEGKWSWKQDPWHGFFTLKKSGNSYTGTLDDVFEGTYGDLITDVELSKNNIKFVRDGQFGIQHWQGTLKVEDGLLKIVDGTWTKGGNASGTFHAEKTD
jgi:hypothetical protein